MDEFDASGKSAKTGDSWSGNPSRASQGGETADTQASFPDIPSPEDVVFSIDDAVDDVVRPERKYSFNALVAVGITGFLVGRLLSR